DRPRDHRRVQEPSRNVAGEPRRSRGASPSHLRPALDRRPAHRARLRRAPPPARAELTPVPIANALRVAARAARPGLRSTPPCLLHAQVAARRARRSVDLAVVPAHGRRRGQRALATAPSEPPSPPPAPT